MCPCALVSYHVHQKIRRVLRAFHTIPVSVPLTVSYVTYLSGLLSAGFMQPGHGEVSNPARLAYGAGMLVGNFQSNMNRDQNPKFTSLRETTNIPARPFHMGVCLQNLICPRSPPPPGKGKEITYSLSVLPHFKQKYNT